MPTLMTRYQRTIDDAFKAGEAAMRLGCRVITVVPDGDAIRHGGYAYWLWLEVPDGLDFNAVDDAMAAAGRV